MKSKLYKAAIQLPNGKRKWLSSTDKEELERKKQELLMQIGAGLDFSDNSTFGEYAEMWLRVYKERTGESYLPLSVQRPVKESLRPPDSDGTCPLGIGQQEPERQGDPGAARHLPYRYGQ